MNGFGILLSAPINAINGTTTGGSIVNNGASNQIINIPIAISSGKHMITNTAAGQLNLNGAITRNNNGTVVFTNSGGGSINVTGSGLANDTSNAGGILGGWATIGLGTNTGDWATLDGGGNVVAYTGYTAVAPATAITSGATQNIRVSANGGNITMAAPGTTDVNTILYNGTAGNQTIDVGLGNTLRVAQGGIMVTTGSAPSFNRQLIIGAAAPNNGTLTAGGTGELFLYNNSLAGTNNDLTINSVVADNGGTPVSVNVLGYVVLNGVNTYTGGTTIAQGRVQAGNNGNSLGATGSNVTVLPGAQAFINANFAFNYNWFLNGVGSTESNGLGAIRAGTGKTIAGNITLVTDSAIGAGNGNPTITADITGLGGLIIGHGNNANGSGTPIFGNGTGTQTYTYQGNTLINDSTTTSNTMRIAAGSNNLLPHGIGTGNVIMDAKSGTILATLDLNGTSQIINGLNTTGTSPANNFVSNSNVAPSTLTVGDNNANGAFGGVIQNGTGGMSLIKTGSGTQTLSGANTYTGATTVAAGTLAVSGTINSTSGVTINGGAFNYTNNGTALNRNVTIAGGNFRYNSTAQYTGALTFTSGTISGSGNLAGTALTIGAGQILSPGNSPGTLNTGSQTWATGGSYLWEINDVDAGAGTDPGWDFANITGTLDITASIGSEFTINVVSLTLGNVAGNVGDFNASNSYTWTIATASGGITGFNNTDFLVNTSAFSNAFGGVWGVQQNGNSIELFYTSPIPEPSTYAMLLGGAIMLLTIYRRKTIRI